MNSKQQNVRQQTVQNSRGENVKYSSRQRKKKNHKKTGLVYLLLVLFVIGAGVCVSFTVIFNTSSIIVENTAVRYSDERIIEASGIAIGDNMPRMNTTHIASEIEKKLPYIGSVKIKRSLSGTVTISVEYTKATAAIETAAGYVMLNSAGKVLETDVLECADYIAVISGVEIEKAEAGENIEFTDPEGFTYVTELMSDFEAEGYNNLTALDITDTSNVTAEIDYRITVKLGSITKASSKLKFGKAVIDENLSNTSAGRLIIDLTGDETAYVRSEKNIEALKESMEKTSLEQASAEEESEEYEESEPTEIATDEDEATEESTTSGNALG